MQIVGMAAKGGGWDLGIGNASNLWPLCLQDVGDPPHSFTRKISSIQAHILTPIITTATQMR